LGRTTLPLVHPSTTLRPGRLLYGSTVARQAPIETPGPVAPFAPAHLACLPCWAALCLACPLVARRTGHTTSLAATHKHEPGAPAARRLPDLPPGATPPQREPRAPPPVPICVAADRPAGLAYIASRHAPRNRELDSFHLRRRTQAAAAPGGRSET